MKSELVYGAGRHRRPACATPGPSTTCSRPSPRRGWRARRRASSPARSWRRSPKVNVDSLKEFDYFTVARAERQEGRAQRAGRLLSRIHRRAAHAALHPAVQDAREGAEPRFRDVRSDLFRRLLLCREGARALAGAPAACKIAALRPGEGGAGQPQGQPGEAFFNNLGAASNFGAQFANKIAVKCP